jgi:hypothetical protein
VTKTVTVKHSNWHLYQHSFELLGIIACSNLIQNQKTARSRFMGNVIEEPPGLLSFASEPTRAAIGKVALRTGTAKHTRQAGRGGRGGRGRGEKGNGSDVPEIFTKRRS